MVGAAQIGPVGLDRASTLTVVRWSSKQRKRDAVSGRLAKRWFQPIILVRAHRRRAVRFRPPERHSRLLYGATARIKSGHLETLSAFSGCGGIPVDLGVAERHADRGGDSLYRSRVHIGANGAIASVHRKLVRTYDKRLCLAPGSGQGLQVHKVGAFDLGANLLRRMDAVNPGNAPANRSRHAKEWRRRGGDTCSHSPATAPRHRQG